MTDQPTVERPTRRDASMRLVTDLLEHPLDGGYAEATARHRAAGEPAGRLRSTPLLVVGLALVGLLLATAAAQVRDRATAQETTRSALVTEAQERVAANDRLSAELEALRAEIAAVRGEALELTDAGAALARRLADLGAASGAVPVEGPGLVLTVDDAERPGDAVAAEPGGPDQVDQGRVRDRDLQRLVNGLWAAGAEAVAVNGQRLTSLTAIRSAGQAVLVGYRPLVPPYVVSAVGDPVEMERRFLDGDAGLYLEAVLSGGFDIRYTLEPAERLVLPGASVTLRHAVVAGTDRGAR